MEWHTICSVNWESQLNIIGEIQVLGTLRNQISNGGAVTLQLWLKLNLTYLFTHCRVQTQHTLATADAVLHFVFIKNDN